MKRKIFLSLTAIPLMVAPTITLVSCGKKPKSVVDKDTDNDINNDGNEENGVLISNVGTKPGASWGKENFQNPDLTFLESRNLDEYRERSVTGQPFTLHYHPRDLQVWQKGKDADDAFNKGTIPLANREHAFKILDSQFNTNLDILTGLNKATSKTFQGTVSKDDPLSRMFTMWSNINSITSWGGSTSEGLYVIPKGSDINAAHRHGVPIIATLFVPPTLFGGNTDMYNDIVKKDAHGKYIVADNMIEMARYYGFDGWFLNWEVPNVSGQLATDLKNFQEYLYERSKEPGQQELYVQLYDWGVGKQFYQNGKYDIGSIDYQNRNSKVTHNAPAEALDKLSYGYNFGSGGLNSGDEGGTWNMNDNTKSNYVGDKNAWIYTYLNDINPIEGDEGDLSFFSSSEGGRDPRINGDDKWYELAKAFNQRTTIIERKNFSTNFQLGFGTDWYTEGEANVLGSQIKKNGWKNGGIQGVLPTWRYIIDTYNTSDTTFASPLNRDVNGGVTPYVVENKIFKVTIDERAAYNGSTALNYSGKLQANNRLVNQLYASKVNVMSGDKFEYIIDSNTTTPEVAIWFENEKSPVILTDKVSTPLSNGYFKQSFVMPQIHNNKKMISFGLSYSNETSSTIDLNSTISQLDFLVNTEEVTPNVMTKIVNEGEFLFMGQRNVRLNWEMTNRNEISHYVVYGSKTRGAYNKDYVLSVTPLPAAYLVDVEKFQDVPLVIVAYDHQNNIVSENNVKVRTSFAPLSDPAKWSVEWDDTIDEHTKWKVNTNSNYTTSFKDSDDLMFFGDDSTRIHAVRNGKLETNRTEKWGQKLEGDGINTLSISRWDEENILVITSIGTAYLLNSKTGVINESFDKTKLKTLVASKITDKVEIKDENKVISNISFVKKVGNQSLIIGEIGGKTATDLRNENGGIGFAALISDNGEVTEITLPQDTVIEGFVHVSENNYKAIARSYGNLLSGRQLRMIDITIGNSINEITIPNIEWSDNTKNFTTSLINKVQSIAFGQAAQIFARGQVVHSLKIDDKYVFVNSMGIIYVLDENGSVLRASSIVSSLRWQAILTSANALKGEFGTIGFGLLDMLQFMNKFSNERIITNSGFYYDEESNDLIFSYVAKFINAGEGQAIMGREAISVSLSKMLEESNEDIFLETKLSINLPTETIKRLDGIKFIQKLGSYYIVGGNNKSVGVLNSQFQQIQFGKKIYYYDGYEQLFVEYIYDDGDRTIPAEYMQ